MNQEDFGSFFESVKHLAVFFESSKPPRKIKRFAFDFFGFHEMTELESVDANCKIETVGANCKIETAGAN
ncbi:hypothetical protein [Methanolapillus millepedarum]|uniref:hypothetical protein n=1 Tax=Methanolapillus millepedarum TaxID=3028296 RepID=UPI0030B8C126